MKSWCRICSVDTFCQRDDVTVVQNAATKLSKGVNLVVSRPMRRSPLLSLYNNFLSMLPFALSTRHYESRTMPSV